MSGSILELPCRIGDITLLERLGAGGMAEVFLATQGEGPRAPRVVVKRMLPHLAMQSQFRALFRREAATGLRVVHPNVVRTLDLVENPQGMMLVVEYVDGLTLRALARAAYERRARLPLPVVLRMVRDAALGLSGIHATTDDQGLCFLHRDISPDNLIVDRSGRTRVLDFGIARPGGEFVLTRTGELRGKLPFMSPEQIDARVLDARSDLYSLGVTLFWMLTGRRPFVHKSEVRLLQMIILDAPPSLSAIDATIPADVDALVQSLLAKEKDQRPADADTVAGELQLLGACSAADVASTVEVLMDSAGTTVPVRNRAPLPQPSQPLPEITSPILGGDASPMLDENSEWGKTVGRSQRHADQLTPAASPRPKHTVRYAIATATLACAVTLGLVLVVRDAPTPAPPATIASAPPPPPPASPPAEAELAIQLASPPPAPSTSPAPATSSKSPAMPPAKRAFRVQGAPASAVWRAAGKTVGRGDAELSLAPGTKKIEGTIAGVVVTIVVDGASASFAELPRGTLSVRGHGGKVLVGDQSHEVPARITSLAGTWQVRHVTDTGTAMHKVVVRPGPPSSPTILSLVEP